MGKGEKERVKGEGGERPAGKNLPLRTLGLRSPDKAEHEDAPAKMPEVTTARVAAMQEKEIPENHASISASFIVCRCPYQAPPSEAPCSADSCKPQGAAQLRGESPQGGRVALRLNGMTERRGLDKVREPRKSGRQEEGFQDGAAGMASAGHSRPRGHGFSAPGGIVYQLTLHLCLAPWSLSPGFGGSAWQSLSPSPPAGSQGAGRGLSAPGVLRQWRTLPLTPCVPHPHPQDAACGGGGSAKRKGVCSETARKTTPDGS